MRHLYTLLFLAWGSVLILMAVVKLARGKALPDVAALGCMGLIGIALSVAVWTFMGRMEKERLQATATVEQAETAAPAAPAERSGTLARRMAGQLGIALAVWFAVVVLISLAGGIVLRDMRYAGTIGLLRFGTLFWKSFLIVLAADVILWLAAFHWVNDEPGPGWFSKIAAIIFAALPVIVGVLGITSLFRDRDPWEYLPGGPPFALREFAAKHPQLHVETVGALGGDVVWIACGSLWPRVVYSEGELREADLTWEKCSDADTPERLGGPPPFPNSRCLARIETRRPDYDAVTDEELDQGVVPPDIRTVRYVYSAGWVYTSEVTKHFLNWAKSVGPEPNVYGYLRYWMEVTANGKTWTIQIRGLKRTVDDVYIEYTDRTPARAEKE
jgi:hypothetical protein